MKQLTILLIVLICGLLLLTPTHKVEAAITCPTIRAAWAAQLDITDGTGRHYLIDPLEQGLASQPAGVNVANLGFASKPDRWLINGIKIDPVFHYVYHIAYWDQNWRSAGETWFATLDGHPNVYFYFVVPAVSADHPNCAYGSVKRSTVDALLKPRR